MLFDFVSNSRRFLQGDWLNASAIIKYWAYAKPSAEEIATVKADLNHALLMGSPDALLLKGIILYYNLEDDRKNFVDALSCFERAAKHRVFASQMLSVLYERGEIDGLNFAQLVNGCKKVLNSTVASSSEKALAAYNLGCWCLRGFGVLRDFTAAREYFTQAANLGEGEAYYYLGVMCECGTGVSEDSKLALEHYENAAKLHNSRALDKLGKYYKSGAKTARNQELALQYYMEAAELGESCAFTHLGELYEKGDCVPKKFNAAEDCYKTALSLGDPHAAEHLVDLYKGVSAWYGSSLVVELDLFAKNTLKKREINYLAAKILGNNLDDLCRGVRTFLMENTKNAQLLLFLRLLEIVDYLSKNRADNDGLDYRVKLIDFCNLTQNGVQAKYAMQKYLENHPLRKKIFRSNRYVHLRSKLKKILVVITDEAFFQALETYRIYLDGLKAKHANEEEAVVAQRLSDACEGRGIVLPNTGGTKASVSNSCCFFAKQRSSLPEASFREIELKPVV